MCEELGEHKGRKYYELQELLDILCEEYNLDKIQFKYIKEPILSKGRFSSTENAIYLNIIPGYEKCDYIPVIYHEFRHYWQYLKYYDVYKWWLYDNQDLYQEIDKSGNKLCYRICELELDADTFSKSYGEKNQEKILKEFTFNREYYEKKISLL